MTPADLEKALAAAKAAAAFLRTASVEPKNRVLLAVARLLKERENGILKANAEDLARFDGARKNDEKKEPERLGPAFRDRLALNPKRLAGMIESLKQVAALADPVGEVAETRTLENGLKLSRVRAPLGVIFLIFESRPNVAVEAFSLAFKAGNAVLLRGGKESSATVAALYAILAEALAAENFPRECVWGITDPDRALVQTLLAQAKFIDVVIPRGGDALIEFVTEHSRIPVIKNDRGMCHVYVHEDADLEMAAKIVQNAKTQRPGVCNAMETCLVHASVAARFLPKLHAMISSDGPAHPPVEWFADKAAATALARLPRVRSATAKNWDTEYLDYKMNCRVVDSLDEALAHIGAHGSKHSETIVTSSETSARRFFAEVDAAAVYWNASTRFTDGFEFGLGGEIGISTQKLHVRGPVGLRELTNLKWIIEGKGQVRA